MIDGWLAAEMFTSTILGIWAAALVVGFLIGLHDGINRVSKKRLRDNEDRLGISRN